MPPAECSAKKGVITHRPSNRTTTYGKVAAAASNIEVPKAPKLKDPKDWTLIGTSPPRFDIPDKTNGKQLYTADVRLPGMLHASIVQCPVFGGKLKSVDDSQAKAMRGVKKIVKGEDWVAVVADNWWRANRALQALTVEWDVGENGNVSSESIMQFLRTGIEAKEAPAARKDGDFNKAIAGAAKVIEAEYYAPVPEPRDDGTADGHGALSRTARWRCGSARRTVKPRSPRQPRARAPRSSRPSCTRCMRAAASGGAVHIRSTPSRRR